jgi:hypothetical protein
MNEKLKQLDEALIIDLNGKKYYDGFDTEKYAEVRNQFWPGSTPADGIYEHWISTYRPEVVIEVGSFLGYSTIKMAKEVKRLGLPTKIIAIDTWLGTPGCEKDPRMGYINGYPTLYHKFVTLVIDNDVQDVICPFPFPSIIAFRILEKTFKEIGIKADFIFVDGSHEELDVYLDLYHYYQLLKPGGFMWGDDWAGWEGVRTSVKRFCSENSIQFNVLQNNVHWFFQK